MKILLLIVYYVGFMIAGDLSDYLIGLIVEREFGSQVSPIFAYVGRLGPCSWECEPFHTQSKRSLLFCR